MYEELICPVLGKLHSDVDENPIIRSGIAIIGLAKGPKPQACSCYSNNLVSPNNFGFSTEF